MRSGSGGSPPRAWSWRSTRRPSSWPWTASPAATRSTCSPASTSPTPATRASPSARSRAAAWSWRVLIGASLALLVGYFVANRDLPLLWLPVGLLLGGALGNLADRAREGAVIDFIDPVAWPAFNVADAASCRRVRAALVGGGERRRRASALELPPPRTPGCASTPSWRPRGAAPSRAAAQRLIEAGAVTVDGAARPEEPPPGRGRGRGRGQPRRDAAARAGGGARVRGRLRGRAPAGGRQARRARHPPGAGARGPDARRGARRPCRRRRPTPSAPASCTGSTATPRGCWWWRSPRQAHAALSRSCRRARCDREYLALVGGPPGRRERHDRRPDRPRPRTPHVLSTRTDRPRDGGDPLRGRRAAAAHGAAARAARDRPHPPDPRAPRRDRPSGLRRPANTGAAHAAGGSAWSASSCTPQS